MFISNLKFITTVGALLVTVGPYVTASDDEPTVTYLLNNYCALAQGVIANTDLTAEIHHYSNLTDFIDSDAWPYDGAGVNLTLTVSQYAGLSFPASTSAGTGQAQTVMCKMKSWDALNYYYPGSASQGSNCSAVNKMVADHVIRRIREENSAASIPSIVYDDLETYAGPQWTDESPSVTAYIGKRDGLLHLLGKEMYVARTNKFPFIGPTKKGVDYCQTVAPEYLRSIILNKAKAPICDSPAQWAYTRFIPIPLLKWHCDNPSSNGEEKCSEMEL